MNEADINAYRFSPHTANADIMPPPQDVPGIQNSPGDNIQNNDQHEVALSQLSIEEYLPINIENILLLIMRLLVLRSFMRIA